MTTETPSLKNIYDLVCGEVDTLAVALDNRTPDQQAAVKLHSEELREAIQVVNPSLTNIFVLGYAQCPTIADKRAFIKEAFEPSVLFD